MAGQLISGNASNNSSTVTLTTTPQPGDILIVGAAGYDGNWTPPADGTGATWELLLLQPSLAVWIGRGASAPSVINLNTTGFGRKFVFHLRGVSDLVELWSFAGYGNESTGVRAPSMQAGPDNVVLAFTRSQGSSAMSGPATLPNVAAWSTPIAGDTEMAVALPGALSAHAMEWTWPATGNGKIGVQMVVGDPTPSAPIDLEQTGATETSVDAAWTDPASPPLPYLGTVLDDAPAAYWRLGETAGTTMTDASGNGRNGTYTGGMTKGQASLIQSDAVDKSIDFFGGRGELAYAAWMDSQAFTVEALVEIKQTTLSGVRTFVNRRNGNTWQFRMEGGELQLPFWSTTTGLTWLRAPSRMTAGIHHIAASLDMNTGVKRGRMYVDGRLVREETFAGNIVSAGSSMTVGADGSGGEAHNARLDEVAYFTRELPPERIFAHHTAALGYSGVAPVDAFEYRIDGGAPVDVGHVLATSVPGLDPGEVYTMQVRSRTGVARSAWTAPVAMTTLEPAGLPMYVGSQQVTKLYLGASPVDAYHLG